MQFYCFQLELLADLLFVCTVTALPNQRIFPEQKDTFELHLCYDDNNGEDFFVTLHMPGQPVKLDREPVPVKMLCASIKTLPGCYKRLQMEHSCTQIKHLKQEQVLLPLSLHIGAEFSARIHFLFTLLRERYQAGIKDKETLIKMMRLLSYLSWNDLISDSFSSYYVTAAFAYIRKNFKNKITIASIANEIGITPNYLSRLFQEKTGKTVKNILDIVRASSARESLYYCHVPYRIIAKQNGFSNEKSMNQIFLKLFHMTPQQCNLFDQKNGRSPWEAETGMIQLIFSK